MQDGPNEEEHERVVPTEAEKWLGKRKASSPTQPIEDEEQEPCEECSAEGCYANCGYHDQRDPELTQSRPVAGKGPLYRQIDEEEEEAEGEDDRACEVDEPEAEADVPDLQAYFDLFDLDEKTVVSMCRAYASYLVSLRPKTSTLGTTKRKTSSTAARRGRSTTPPSQKPHWMKAKRRRQ